jgi:hypothetical protein
MTKNGTTNIQIPMPVQQYYDMALDDPFPSFSMQAFNVGTMIRDHLKNLLEDYVDNNRTVCPCTNLDRLLLLIYELEITYMPVDDSGNIIRTATPLTLDQHSDLCQLFKTCAMNCAITHINLPSRGQISFQPALVHDFIIDALCIQMPVNWQADNILDTDEITTIQFPGVKAGPIVSTGIPSGMPTITTNELMLKFLDTQVLLTSILDPRSSFPPNARKIALSSDSHKHSITDGIYTAEGAELIVQATAELASVTEFYNRPGSTYEEDYGHDHEDDSHDMVQRQND